MSRSSPALLLPFLAWAAFPSLAQAQTASPAADQPPPDKSGYTVLNPTPTQYLRGFNTDRPTKGDSPNTVDAGHFQIETDLFSYTHSNYGGVSTRLYTGLDPLLKLGLTNRVDLELQFNGFNSLDQYVPGTGTRVFHADGAGDLSVRVKVNLFGNEGGVAAALIPYVKLPAAAQGIGNGAYEGGVIAPVTVPLPAGFTLLVMPEVDVLRNVADTGRHFNFAQLINIGYAVSDKVNVYAEFYSALGTDRRLPPVYTADVAATYLLTPTLQLDVGANFGLSRAAPNLQLYTGVSTRF